MKIAIFLLAGLNGGWMLFDGIHVLRFGKYFGPENPGPWQALPKALGLDPFNLGPLFVILGLVWLGAGLNFALAGGFWPLFLVAGLTLWYLPLGTIFAALVMAFLLWGAYGAG